MTRLANLICAGLIMGLGSILLSAPAAYAAALNSNTATVTLTATVGESLTVSATPATATFTLAAGGTANASAPVVMTTTWNLAAARTSLSLTGYFSSAAQALAGTGSTPGYIPTSEVLGQVTTGSPTTYTAFTQNPATGGPGTAGASLLLFTQANSTHVSSRTDSLNLEINLTAQPLLPADTYTGTLNLVAQAL